MRVVNIPGTALRLSKIFRTCTRQTTTPPRLEHSGLQAMVLVGVASLSLMSLLVCAGTARASEDDVIFHCEDQDGKTFCDGPIEADGSWVRCLQGPGERDGPIFLPPSEYCFKVPGEGAIPPDQPLHHIDDE